MAIIKTRKGEEIIVDDEYFDVLSQFSWRLDARGYPVCNRPRRYGKGFIPLHKLIVVAPKGMEVDHINGIKTDARRVNLRICTHSENCINRKRSSRNTSGYKGVSWNANANAWRARITVNKKLITLGHYNDPELAYAAYCVAASRLHGEFANYG